MKYVVRIRIKEGDGELLPGTELPQTYFPKRRAKRLLELGAIEQKAETQGGADWLKAMKEGAVQKNRHIGPRAEYL